MWGVVSAYAATAAVLARTSAATSSSSLGRLHCLPPRVSRRSAASSSRLCRRRREGSAPASRVSLVDVTRRASRTRHEEQRSVRAHAGVCRPACGLDAASSGEARACDAPPGAEDGGGSSFGRAPARAAPAVAQHDDSLSRADVHEVVHAHAGPRRPDAPRVRVPACVDRRVEGRGAPALRRRRDRDVRRRRGQALRGREAVVQGARRRGDDERARGERGDERAPTTPGPPGRVADRLADDGGIAERPSRRPWRACSSLRPSSRPSSIAHSRWSRSSLTSLLRRRRGTPHSSRRTRSTSSCSCGVGSSLMPCPPARRSCRGRTPATRPAARRARRRRSW